MTPLPLNWRELSPTKSNVLLTTAACLVRGSVRILTQARLSVGCVLSYQGPRMEQCTAQLPNWAILVLPVLMLDGACHPLAPGADRRVNVLTLVS